jgi:hypothetical protein
MYHGIDRMLRKAQIKAPRLVSMYFGNHSEISFENEILFAEIFVPIAAKAQQNAAKNWAALLFQRSATWSGFHVTSP